MNPVWLYWLPAIATAALIFGLSHQPSLPPVAGTPDWLAHGLEYGFFTVTLVFATTRGFAEAQRTPMRVVAAVLIATLFGITDEFHQSFVGRDATASDWLADTVGATVVAIIMLALWRRMAGSRTRV